MELNFCELCHAPAQAFCPSDAAFLCRKCDEEVHTANFLVERHIRLSVCTNGTDSSGDCIDDGDSFSSSSSSSTTSRQKECKKNLRRSDVRAEGILRRWCLMIGVGKGEVDTVVKTAWRAVRIWMDGRAVVPSRVRLAAGMWVGLRMSGRKPEARRAMEKRLEEISGVPAAVISAGGWKAEKAMRGEWRRCREMKEGWAEC